MATLSDGTTTWTYTYNADGLRTKRTNGTTTYNYVYNGSKLTQLTVGANTLYISYDANGRPFTVTFNGTVYYYVLNMLGDVIGIANSSGTLVVSYLYDAWGYAERCTGTMAATLGKLNPLRYRSYVYDEETKWYYLQSRYYNPEVGRFINADAFASTGQGLTGTNMFAYCGNNPVNRVDPSGTFWLESALEEFVSLVGTIISSLDRNYNSDTSQIRDVTAEVDAALAKESQVAKKCTVLSLISPLLGAKETYTRFYALVNHYASWDIKREKPWSETIGTPFPGEGANVLYRGRIMTMEQLGNYTYGYLGYQYNIPYSILCAGSYYAADFPYYNPWLEAELVDWVYVRMGYDAALLDCF